jgi:putative SOS response-associated peptidase YedK
VVRHNPTDGLRHLDLLRWGLLPHWAKDPKAVRQPINARAETAATAPMFRDALARRRCLVPMDAFYEWHGEAEAKTPYAIALPDGSPMAAAGLWESWRGPDETVLRTYAILTTTACDALGHLHERMPVLLRPDDWPVWLGEAEGDHAALLRPLVAEFRIWPVSRAVNNVRNNGAELLAAA